MFATFRHEKVNLLPLFDGVQLCRLVQYPASKDVRVAASDIYPHQLGLPVGYPWPTVVDDDLKIIWVLGQETAL